MSIKNDWVHNHKKSSNVLNMSDFDIVEKYLTDEQKQRYKTIRLKSNKYRNDIYLNDFKREMIDYHSNKLNVIRSVTKPFYQRYWFMLLLFLILIFAIYI